MWQKSIDLQRSAVKQYISSVSQNRVALGFVCNLYKV